MKLITFGALFLALGSSTVFACKDIRIKSGLYNCTATDMDGNKTPFEYIVKRETSPTGSLIYSFEAQEPDSLPLKYIIGPEEDGLDAMSAQCHDGKIKPDVIDDTYDGQIETIVTEIQIQSNGNKFTDTSSIAFQDEDGNPIGEVETTVIECLLRN